MKKTIFISAVVALLVSLTTFGVVEFFHSDNSQTFKIEHVSDMPGKSVGYTLDEAGNAIPLDFTKPAEQVMDAVVNIKSTQAVSTAGRQPFQDLFDNDFFRQFHFESPQMPDNGRPQVQVGTGSGVIINSNGYIVTNNHVVADAQDLEVTLHDNRTFKAKVIGTDPSTDLALIQIKASDLPALQFVNSDDVKVGEWVLAVGNPFNLNSTVTAGIVSAKARNINILQEQYAVESFIQTDAAINPGNSGGALVNLQGGLIGINTAIASPTGAYSGYGFAIPSNIVGKVVEDLLNFGVVQRGVLGVMIRSVDGNLAREKELEVNSGAYVDSLMTQSAAAEAGIMKGDVILSVDGQPIKASPELQEMIARHRPGETVVIKVDRKGKEKEFNVVLNNRHGNTEQVSREEAGPLAKLGATLETLDSKTAKKLEISGGVLVKDLEQGILRRNTQMREGFIITKVDGKEVNTLEEFTKVLSGKKGGVLLEGIYEDIPGTYYYAFGLDS